MSGRAEMSPPIQDQEPQLKASGGMKVALIGPNEMHRKIVAKALAGSEARLVREFVDYPASMSDLPQILESGRELPEKPCSFCNRCLVNAIVNPLGCYDVRRFEGDHDAMVAKILEVFHPSQFSVTQ